MITACNRRSFQRATRSRRGLRLAAAFLALALIAAGCGGDDDDGSSASTSSSASASGSSSASASASSSASEPADEEAASDTADEEAAAETDGQDDAGGTYPVTIEHDLGSTTVEATPTRVVSITDQGELAALLALDVMPIAYGQRIPGEVDYLAAEGLYESGAEVIDANVEINFEQLAGLEPDLIVGQIGFITPENIATFEAIAPTIPIGFDDWREGLRDVGAAIDDTEAAEAKIAELDALIEAFPERVPFVEGRSVSVALGFPGFGIYQLTNQSVLGELLAAAGAVPLPDPTSDQDPSGNQLSLEQISLIDGEGLILLDFEGASAGGGADAQAFWNEQPLFPTLPSVEAERFTYWSGGEAAASNFINALTIPVLLDALERTLTEFFAE
ncbi:MAG: ABC transporter substrate-binding protein [Actinomycetota bacterium]